MNAASIARRMAAKHGKQMATVHADMRGFVWALALEHATASSFTHHSARLTLWRAVSTALGRMEASV